MKRGLQSPASPRLFYWVCQDGGFLCQ